MAERAEELAAAIQEIRERVRARHPQGSAPGGVPLPDLMPLFHARDKAEAKVASIGTVNPRPPGFKNNLIQSFKRTVARALNWHVREQIEFNRNVMSCMQAVLEALNDNNRALTALAAGIEELREPARQLDEIRSEWSKLNQEWRSRVNQNEIYYLRGLSQLQASFQHRVTLLEQNFRDLNAAQHANFTSTAERTASELQQRFWSQLDQVRRGYEALIHSELSVIRQRLAAASAAVPASAAAAPAPHNGQPAPGAPTGIDWLHFAHRFRGSEDSVRERQRIYGPRFQGLADVLDIGCGRGEMLEVLREAGVSAQGIDLAEENVALCRSKGLHAERADLFEYLEHLPDHSLGGITCSQVVEHLPPESLPRFARLAHSKLRSGGLLAIETPNPECLAIFATHFYIDPTHTRPVPPALMSFYLEEAGFGSLDVVRLAPAVESMPSLSSLPEDFRNAFFGALDYAIFGVKLG